MVVKVGRKLGLNSIWRDIKSWRSHLYTETCKVCRDPRGFGFIQFMDPADAAEAKHQMDGYLLLGRELTVVFAEENRKKPTEMRTRDRGGRSNRFQDRRRSPPRYSRSPPPRRGRRSRSRSRGYNSPPAKRHQSRSVSPQDRRYEKERSYSRSPPHNGSRVRSGSPGRVKSHSRSPRRSVSPRKNRSYTPEQARSQSPVPRQSRSPTPVPRGAQNGDRSPSQWFMITPYISLLFSFSVLFCLIRYFVCLRLIFPYLDRYL